MRARRTSDCACNSSGRRINYGAREMLLPWLICGPLTRSPARAIASGPSTGAYLICLAANDAPACEQAIFATRKRAKSARSERLFWPTHRNWPEKRKERVRLTPAGVKGPTRPISYILMSARVSNLSQRSTDTRVKSKVWDSTYFFCLSIFIINI